MAAVDSYRHDGPAPRPLWTPAGLLWPVTFGVTLVSAVLATTPQAFDTPPAPEGFGGWWRRHDAAGAAAGAARDAASDAFYEMDRAQRYLRTRVEAFAGLDGGLRGQQVRADFGRLDEVVDAASRAWIDTLDGHAGLEGAEGSALSAATQAFHRIAERMREVRARADAFGTAHAGDFARVERALGQVPVRAAAAREAVTVARAAVAAALAAGLRPAEASTTLRQAESFLATVDQGAQARGITESLRAADEATSRADLARRAAEELPRRRDAARRELTAVRTRWEVVEAKAVGVEATMSQLRRRYVRRAWADVEASGPACGAALARARDLVSDAESLTAPMAQQWDAAMTALEAAREALRVAAAAEKVVTGRLKALDQAAGDPAAAVAGARFTVRDAQLLIMSGTGPRDPDLVRRLDLLAGRLDAMDRLSQESAPDYWHFLTELESVCAEARRVVDAIRAGRATG